MTFFGWFLRQLCEYLGLKRRGRFMARPRPVGPLISPNRPPYLRDFTAQYVEAITAKTGCAKKYATFVRILMSALRQESTSAFIDLLTYRDLEAMKQSRDPRGGKLRAAEEVHSKRYLIVTHSTEHERAHFPLPLLAEDRPPAAGGGRRAQAPRSKRPAQPAAASPGASPGRRPPRRSSLSRPSSTSGCCCAR